jgi:hypothetical protein
LGREVQPGGRHPGGAQSLNLEKFAAGERSLCADSFGGNLREDGLGKRQVRLKTA